MMPRDEWHHRLVSMAADGAAVMMGCNKGVIAKLREQIPHIVSVHCMAHRLELGLKDAAAKALCHKKLDTFLLNLYLFYKKSPLNRYVSDILYWCLSHVLFFSANLKSSFESLKLKMLVPTRTGGTRWVGHTLRALDHFLRGYKGIVQHLEQVITGMSSMITK